MAEGIKKQFRMTPDFYKEKDHSSITDLGEAMQRNGAWLSSVVTHLSYTSKTYGKNNFPMLFLTEGMGNVRKVSDFDYKFPIIGRPKKSSRVGTPLYSPGDKPGVAGSEFTINFEDKHFANQQTIIARGAVDDVSLRIQGEPTPGSAGGWDFRVVLWGDDYLFCPLELLQRGVKWGGSVFKVGFEDSYGVESRSYLGGTATNMVSLVRHSHKIKGNAEAKIMKFEIKADGKTYRYMVDWELYLAELAFREQCEIDLWTSKYSRGKVSGKIKNFDKLTGVAIPSGAGIDQQIPNTDSHSILTHRKLTQIIRDLTFNVTDATPNIEIWTGTGGMSDIDAALKDELRGFTLIDSKQFASGGNNWDMIYGSFFKGFRHVDGGVITFRKHPMFDKGMLGDISRRHPISGLPISSHDIYILDRSSYDGQSNFTYVQEEGREYTKWTVAGAKVPNGFNKSHDFRASDRDASSIHGMKSQGIQIMRPTGCYKSRCIA